MNFTDQIWLVILDQGTLKQAQYVEDFPVVEPQVLEKGVP